MAVLTTDDKTEIIVSCRCGCEDSIHIRVYKEDFDDDCFGIMTYMNGNFYSEQDETIWRVIYKKLRKIWAIIRNKDFYYSDVTMSKSDFMKFREMINSVEVDM